MIDLCYKNKDYDVICISAASYSYNIIILF